MKLNPELNWPYWVRGGIFGLIIFVATFWLPLISPALWIFVIPWFIISILVPAIATSLKLDPSLFVKPEWVNHSGPIVFPEFTLLNGIISGVLALLLYMIIGSFLGWLYGKIKNKAMRN